MAAKRLRKQRPRATPRTLQPPDTPQVERATVTCPGCGATAELADHTCSHCGQLFYQRPNGQVGREPRQGPPSNGPEIAEFAQRMDRIERLTRVICVVAGLGFAALTVISVAPPSWLGVLG